MELDVKQIDAESVERMAENIFALTDFIWEVKNQLERLDTSNIKNIDADLDILYSDINFALNEIYNKPINETFKLYK